MTRRRAVRVNARLGTTRELSAWTLDRGRTLERTFHWPDRAAAVAFAALAAAAGDAFAAAPEIHLTGTAVTVRFTGVGGPLTEGQVEAARALAGRWGGRGEVSGDDASLQRPAARQIAARARLEVRHLRKIVGR